LDCRRDYSNLLKSNISSFGKFACTTGEVAHQTNLTKSYSGDKKTMPTKLEIRQILKQHGIQATNARITKAAKACNLDDRDCYEDWEADLILNCSRQLALRTTRCSAPISA
jgi:hypothetical protein